MGMDVIEAGLMVVVLQEFCGVARVDFGGHGGDWEWDIVGTVSFTLCGLRVWVSIIQGSWM
jgi:hypothetical protein